MDVAGIQVGSGTHYADGWWNVDILPPDTGRHPDELIDLFDLPAKYPATFNKAYLGHILEHIPAERVVDAVNAVAAIVKPGGTIMVVGPCYEKAVSQGNTGWLLDAIRAKPDDPHPWNHAWTPTEALTLEYLQQSVLTDVEVVDVSTVLPPEWCNPSIAEWQTAMRGVVA